MSYDSSESLGAPDCTDQKYVRYGLVPYIRFSDPLRFTDGKGKCRPMFNGTHDLFTAVLMTSSRYIFETL